MYNGVWFIAACTKQVASVCVYIYTLYIVYIYLFMVVSCLVLLEI